MPPPLRLRAILKHPRALSIRDETMDVIDADAKTSLAAEWYSFLRYFDLSWPNCG
jgi:hypothetical protein